MGYDKLCAFSKKTIKYEDKARLIFLAADPFTYKKDDRAFFTETDFVSSWECFKILGFPLRVVDKGRESYEFLDKKQADFMLELINSLTGKSQSFDEICSDILDGKLEGKQQRRFDFEKIFGITYMLISEDAFKSIISKDKPIGFMDAEFRENYTMSWEKSIDYKTSLKEKEDYFHLLLNPSKDKLFKNEQEELNDKMELLYSHVDETEIKEIESKQLELILEHRYKMSLDQEPFTHIRFPKVAKKNPDFILELSEGMTNNIWISEAFNYFKIPFMPIMSTTNTQQDSEMMFFYKEMAALIQDSLNQSKYNISEIPYSFRNGIPIINKSDLDEYLETGNEYSTAFYLYFDSLKSDKGLTIINTAQMKASHEDLYHYLFDSEVLPYSFHGKTFYISN